MKKIFALVLVALMIVASMSAVAEVAIQTNSTTHTYQIFQIFKGESDGNNGLTSLKYGFNTKDRTYDAAVSQTDITALNAINDAGTTQKLDQSDIAAMLPYVDLTGTPYKVVGKGNNAKETVDTGYYLIRDLPDSLNNTNDQYTLYLMQVVDDVVTITPKDSTTTSDKTVDDINDSNGTELSRIDSSDYDIGDFVPYHLTAHMANNVDAYKKYHLTFVDTLEAGKFDDISALTIKVDGTPIADITAYTIEVTNITAPTKAGFEVKLTFTPKAPETLLPSSLNGKDVTIDFSAKLGEGANIGEQGNLNTFSLKYSNNPNSTDDHEEGVTPDDTVITFTYELDVNKMDEAGQPLNGATFSLYKKYTDAQLTAANKTAVTSITYGNNVTYTIENGDNWVLIDTIEGAAKSQFQFKGLDDGDYLLVETAAPTNYNPIAPQTFTITAEHVVTWGEQTRTQMLTSLTAAATGDSTITFSNNKSTGVVSTDVENKSGSTLPSTGGIGTTIFYVGGGILVVLAGILLVTKRRMKAED